MAEVRAGQLPAPGAVDFQAVPLCLQKNAKDGEQGTQLADAQTSVPCLPTHFPASQEEARAPAIRHPGPKAGLRWGLDGAGYIDRC